MRRSRDNQYLAGVCGGIGERLGVDPTVVRVITVLLVLGAGTGLLVYMAAWLLITRQGEDRSIAKRVTSDPSEMRLAVVVASLVVAVIIGADALGLPGFENLVWPLALSAAGLVFVWRGSSDAERAELGHVLGQVPLAAELTSGSRRSAFYRIALGLILVAVGVGGLGGLVTSRSPWVAARGFLGVLAVIVGFSVVFGPTWLRTVRSLTEERRERVRSQERADMAAHVHDSVLQTLALIQKAAGDPREVSRLARAQERELRSWLFEDRPPGSFDDEATTVAMATAIIEQEVEDDHGVDVDAVVVGDCPLTDDLQSLLAAGREAAVNAAKWSGAATISVFVEVEPESVSLFVHDRGKGFDVDAVPDDRRGITESIRERMSRHGGTATIRSAPGQGTEVELVMARPLPTV
ncbi:MAG TPA: PspC domain-containing protein [Acidimicrobiales bacterium]|nr:PspC domain-containing protein [Acidimicrobiales bacterium]